MQWIKGFFMVVAASAVFLVAGCKKTKTGTFQLNVQAQYGSQPLAFSDDSFNKVIDPLGNNIKLTALQFYLSHMYLVKTDNSLVKLTDIDFFDIANPSALSVSVNNVEGDFKGIVFYCGVDSVMDAIPVGSAASPPGLEAGSANHWPMLEYQFEHIEGYWDTAWLPIMRGAFTYHVGSQPYYRHAYVGGNFSVCCGQTTTKTLSLDFEKIFFYNGTTQILDITSPRNGSYTQCTQDTAYELTVAWNFSDNFAQAFNLQ